EAAAARATTEPATAEARASPTPVLGRAPGHAGARRGRVALGQLDRDLVDEARGQVALGAAEELAFARPGQVEALFGAGDADVTEAPLLLFAALLERPHVGEGAVLAADDEDRPVLQPLRVVERHQRHFFAFLALQRVLLGAQHVR